MLLHATSAPSCYCAIVRHTHNVPLGAAQPCLCRGGFKKSGIGREMGPLALLPFLEVKSVTGWPSDKAVGWYPETHFKA